MDTATHKVHHHDAATGETVEREPTNEEMASWPVPTGNESKPGETSE